MARAGCLVAAALAAACLIAGCGGGDDRTTSTPTAPTPAPEPKPAPPVLATGLVESNAQLLGPHGATDFAAWRKRVAELRPTYVRLMVDWGRIQPDGDVAADLATSSDGCLRGLAPCGAYAGLRAQLKALAARQKADPGRFGIVLSFHGVPEWAAVSPRGCERPNTTPWSRPISDEGLRGYRRMLSDITRLAQETGARIDRWSPWNEPNHPTFISPQRLGCDRAVEPRSPKVYAQLARAVADAVGADRLLLGDFADHTEDTKRGVAVRSFVLALPDDVACATRVWAQHAYAEVRPEPGKKDPIHVLQNALDERECTRGAAIWVTETGALGADPGRPRPVEPAALRAGCRAQARMLRRWARDPRVDAAFQYTFREDTRYQVGLADAGLTRLYPTFALWKAYGERDASAPAPPLPADCVGA